MIQFGYSAGFTGFSNYAPQPVQNLPQAGAPEIPAHTTANPTMQAPMGASMNSPMSGTMAMPMYPVAMMSPAYMMAYPQMSNPTFMASPGMASGGMQGMNGATMPGATAAPAGGHVTANPTNSLASSSMSGMGGGFGMDPMSGMGGYGGFGGVGMYGAFVMPVIMMSPVFFQMGYPVFQGSQAQPPVSSADVPTGVQDDVPASPGVEAPAVDLGKPVASAPVNADGVVIDVVPTAKNEANDTSSQPLPTLPITELGAEDFAKYRLIEKSKQQETALSLTLTTQDGDTISLDFKQLDSMQMSRFQGRTLEGDKVKDMSMTEETDRVVNMDVIGDLSDDEKAAVDKVLTTIIEAVNKFFSGDVGQAVDKLKQMDFDGQQLAELSLNMSMSKSAGISKAYHNGAEHLHELKNRDADIGQALDFLASEQKRLIDVAKEIFDAPSAAKLVRSLVPPLLSDPFSQLNEQISAANELDAIEIAEIDNLVSEQESKSAVEEGDDD